MGRGEKKQVLRHLIHPGVLVVIAVLIAGLFSLSMLPPAPRSQAISQDEFSAERAMVILSGLLAESEPHVVGSPLNREIRSRIENVFAAQGYQPEVQSLFHCKAKFLSCAHVENVIAVKPGTVGRDAILVTAHYDSSWAGPGAGDDGSGTAMVLEMARMAAEYSAFQNDLIFLITDGEEQGLIGADAFAQHHPLFAKVSMVINVEARGVTGPSMMFETGDGNRSVIRILSKSLDRPVANSVSYEVYKRMPNDTDYSVYRDRGVMGVNFAFSGGVALYHSRLDDVEHLDQASMQHQGQNAWSMLLALADRDIASLQSREDAAYLDIFGRVLWHYPVSIASGVTLVLTVLLLLGIAFRHKAEMTASGVIWAVIAQFTVLGLLVGGAWILNWPLGHMVDTHPIEHPAPWVARGAIFVLCGLVIWIGGKLFAHRVSFGDATLVSWVSFSGLAFYLDFNLPAASFVALFPMAAFLIGMLFDLLRWRSRSPLVLATLFGFCTAAYIAVYFFFLLDLVVPFSFSHFKAAPLALVLVPFLPVWFSRYEERIKDWRPAFVLAGLVAAIALFHQLLPGFSEDRPRGMNLVYQQEGTVGDSGWLYLESPGGNVDTVYADTMGFSPQTLPARFSSDEVALGYEPQTVSRYAVEVPSFELPAAAVGNIVASPRDIDPAAGGPGLSFSVVAPEDSERLVIAFPKSSKILEARVGGVVVVDAQADVGPDEPRTLFALTYPGSEPIAVEVRFQEALPDGFTVTTRLPLPASIIEDYRGGWPRVAQPIYHGFRSEVVAGFPLSAD